jgi:hypothetical protein
MARFYAKVHSDSSKNPTTRAGYSQITSCLQGWSSGVKVVAARDAINPERDIFKIYSTKGSTGEGIAEKLIGVIETTDEGGPRFIPA